MRTLQDLPASPQRVLMRVDLNLPFVDGKISDETRVHAILPTLASLSTFPLVLISHLGRPPMGNGVESRQPYSLEPIAQHLRQEFGLPLSFCATCVGEEALKASHSLRPGNILLLENLRFHSEEEANDLAFAKALAAHGDCFINEAFSVSHRAHASVVGIPQFLPSYGGLHFSQEIQALESIVRSPQRPVMALVGGAKISTKLKLLENLLGKVDCLAIVGAMAHPFLEAQGFSIGNSFTEKELVPYAARFLEKSREYTCPVILPVDGVCEGTPPFVVPLHGIDPSHRLMDIGPQTLALLKTYLQSMSTVLWNGPAGLFEVPPYDHGTKELARLIADATQNATLISIAGGGDTAAALGSTGGQFTYVSTAGGAFLEWLEGNILPGIRALEESAHLC